MSNLWYKDAVFYELYVRAFYDSNGDGNGDLRGVIQKLDYLVNLGVDCIWLLPIYPSPLKDDGYDVADYYGILSEYGTPEDFKTLVVEAHQRGLRVITELVLNHTSDQHPWFQSARSDRSSQYREYYVWSDSDQKYSQTRIIFLDTEPSNWTWDEQAGQYFWHRFYACQPDLNYDSPAVQEEMFRVMKYWLDLGIDGFRADAVPYLFEREGTNCENLPETHAYLKRIRRFMEENYPGRILLCEANQWPEDVRPYFGDGDEFQMGFHFPLMPRVYMALEQGDRSALEWILARTPEIPDNCQWCTFLRNHDELTLEMVTEEERQWMWQVYAPESRMRLNLGIRRRLAPLLGNDRRKIELAYAMLFSMPGSPVIYYGDEIGMGDDIWLPDRNGVRTPMQWEDTFSAGFSGAHPAQFYAPVIQNEEYGTQSVNVEDQRRKQDSLWNSLRNLIHVRKNHSAFGWGRFRWFETDSQIAAYWREYRDERLLVINNLSQIPQVVKLHLPKGERYTDLLSGRELILRSEELLKLHLQPYGYQWLGHPHGTGGG